MSGFALFSTLYVAGIKCFSAFKFSLYILQGKFCFGVFPMERVTAVNFRPLQCCNQMETNSGARLFVYLLNGVRNVCFCRNLILFAGKCEVWCNF